MNQELAAMNAELELLRVVAKAAQRLVRAATADDRDDASQYAALRPLEIALAVAGYDPSPQI
jgi:hypothetical protein